MKPENPSAGVLSAVWSLVTHVCQRMGLSRATTSYCRAQAVGALYGGASPEDAVCKGIATMGGVIAAMVTADIVRNHETQAALREAQASGRLVVMDGGVTAH